MTIYVSRAVRDVLVDAGRLPTWSEDDRDAVTEALQLAVDDLAVTP